LALSLVWRAVRFLDEFQFDRHTYLPARVTQNEAASYGEALLAHWLAQRHPYRVGYRIGKPAPTDLLDAMAHKKATEPRDHVFALKTLHSDILSDIPIDYLVDISALFCEAAAALIKWYAVPSQVLHYATCAVAAKRKDLPSWVPDWTVQESVSPWPWDLTTWDYIYTGDALSKYHRRPSAGVSPDHRRLTIVAVPLGFVGTLSEPLPSISADTDDKLWLESLSKRFRSWLAVCEQAGMHGANMRLYELFSGLLRYPQRLGREKLTKLWFCQNVAPLELDPTPYSTSSQNASLDFLEILTLKSRTPSGRLFVTAGNTMCVCKDAQQGDVVFFLPMTGGTDWSEPWILRHAEKPGCYRVIGPAIVSRGLQPDNRKCPDVLPLGDPETIDLV
jgi:hypothetical protein